MNASAQKAEIMLKSAKPDNDPFTIRSLDALQERYGAPVSASISKESEALTPAYAALIKASPFMVLASAGAEFVDISPKGDAPGFVKIMDDATLAIADRRGNNRIDTLRNILHDPRVSLLFLIPGCNETLRVKGRAEISIRPDLLDAFEDKGKQPATVIIVTIEKVYFHCGRALISSSLWDADKHIDRAALPSVMELLQSTNR